MNQDEKHRRSVAIEHIVKRDFSVMDQLELLFVLEGQLKLIVNGNNRTVQTGEIFIINQGDLVSIPEEKKNRTLSIIIEDNLYDRKIPSFQLNQPLSFIYMKEAYEQIAKTIAAVYVETLYGRDGYSYMIESYLKKIYGLLVRYIPVSKSLDDSLSGEASGKIKEVMNYINENYCEKMQLDELADIFYVNKYYLSHLFKEQLGITIGNYIKEVRLSHSEKDLLGSNEKLMAIALQNGFPNAKALTQAFKEKHGMTPSDYRKREPKGPTNYDSDPKNLEVDSEVLAQFIEEEDIQAVQQYNIKRIEKQVNMNKVSTRNEKRDYVMKLKPDNFDKLDGLREFSENHYIGIGDIFDLVDVSYRNGELYAVFYQLDKRISKIVQKGFTPYIQLQAIDYDQWKSDYEFNSDELFIETVLLLKNHLVNEYSDFSDWHVEFRCFYESEEGPYLCRPLVEALSVFKGYPNIVIHFPVFPPEARNYKRCDSPDVYCINDYTEAKVIDFEKALENLKEEKYIQVIKEQRNVQYQINLFQRIEEYEKDDYLSNYSGMIQAVISIWNFIRKKQQMHHYISPLSVDTTKPFEYFPVELAKRYSMFTEEGFVTENWYAHKFISALFRDVVFRNEYCIITKHCDNYNLLMLYPEEEVLNYLDRKKDTKSVIFEKNSKQPYMQLDLNMTGLTGTYKIIQQSLNRDVIDQKTEVRAIKQSRYISVEDITYYNAIYAPVRSVKEVDIDNSYTLKVNVPILGFAFIEFKKIK